MNLLCVVPFLSLPPNNGGAVRAFNIISGLAQHHRVSVITYSSDGQENLQEWARKHLQSLTFISATRQKHVVQNRAATLRRLLSFPPSFLQHFPSAPLIAAIDKEFSKPPHPDFILFDTLMTGKVLTDKRWPAPSVLTLYDVASNYQWRQFAKLDWRPYKIVLGLEWLKLRYYERQIVRHFQTLAAVSPQDMVAIQRMHPAGHILYTPNGVDTKSLRPNVGATDNNVLFIGNWDYGPNVEGLWYFYESIWPSICGQIDAHLLVVGHHIPTRINEIAKHDTTIQVAGDVPDVRPFYAQANVCIVPLLAGEGTRLKILEAFALGVPVVSTSIGCEGLNVKDGETLLVADTPDAFAEAVLRLLRNPRIGLTLTKNARALTEAQYDWKIIVSNFQAELMQLAVDL